jgi:hypothetical protein
VVREAGELRTDPTYVDSNAEEALRSRDALSDCTFYPINPSLPIYRVQTASFSLENAVSSIQFEHISSSLSHDLRPAHSDVTRTPPGVRPECAR